MEPPIIPKSPVWLGTRTPIILVGLLRGLSLIGDPKSPLTALGDWGGTGDPDPPITEREGWAWGGSQGSSSSPPLTCPPNFPHPADARTPLHCAASCSDTGVCVALVRHGAAIFATTTSDGSLAVEKCDPYREGYADCYNYLTGTGALGVYGYRAGIWGLGGGTGQVGLLRGYGYWEGVVGW